MDFSDEIREYREKPRSSAILSEAAREAAQKLKTQVLSQEILSISVKLLEFLSLVILATLICKLILNADYLTCFLAAIIYAISYILIQQILDAYHHTKLRNFNKIKYKTISAIIVPSLLNVYVITLIANLNDSEQKLLLLCSLVICSSIYLSVLRYLVAHLVRNWLQNGVLERRAVIIGGGEYASEFLKKLNQNKETDIRIVGIFDDRADGRCPELSDGYPLLGTVDELIEFARIAKLDILIMTLPVSAQVRMFRTFKKTMGVASGYKNSCAGR